MSNGGVNGRALSTQLHHTNSARALRWTPELCGKFNSRNPRKIR